MCHSHNSIQTLFLVNCRLNEQLKPIVDLLRETENIVLAPEILEPSPQGIKKVCLNHKLGKKMYM